LFNDGVRIFSRVLLSEKARVVVAARKAKEVCLGGPGEYDIRR